MSRSVRTVPLLARHALADIGASVLVAVLVLLVTFTVAAAPRALERSSTAELRHDVAAVAVPLRDISSVGPVVYASGRGRTGLPASLAGTFGLMDATVRRLPRGLPEPIAGLIGDPDYFGRDSDSAPPQARSADPAKRGATYNLRYAADPRFASRVTIVQGAFPVADDLDSAVVDVIMSVDSAKQAQWDVGETRTLSSAGGRQGDQVRLSGTFTAKHPAAAYWQHGVSVLVPEVHANPTSKPQVVVTAYPAPGSIVSGRVQLGQMVLTVWYHLDTTAIDAENVGLVLPQLRKFLGTIHTVPAQFDNQPLTLESSTLDALETSVDRMSVTDAVLSMAASGPLGVVLAVFALGALSVVDRRRAALALAWSRGGSAWQVRGAMALEGLLLGVVPGAVAIVAAVALVPAPSSPVSLAPAALLALAPAVFFALAASPRTIRSSRADLDPRARGRVRVVVEALVVLLAIVALVLLFRRGIASNGVFDPLLAATPLLLSLAVTVVVLRLYPAPLYAVFRVLARGRGIVGFLGAARGVRDPVAGVSAVLAVVVAVAISIFSVTLVSTLDAGQRASARAAAGGGDIAVSTSLYFSNTQLAAFSRVRGVRAVAAVADEPQVAISPEQNVDLLESDTATLGATRGDLPAGLGRLHGGAIPVMVSDDFDPAFRVGDHFPVAGKDVVVEGVLPAASGLGADSEWVLMDTTLARTVVDGPVAPQVAVIAAPGDPKPVTPAIAGLDPYAAFATYRSALAETRLSPVAASLGTALRVGILAGALLAAIALVLTSIISGRSRDRTIGALRTLGLTRAQSAQLVLWELVPVVVTALVAGTLLGLALPYTVVAAVDLSTFTGGTVVATPVFTALPVLGVLGIVLLATAAASLVAVLVALRRTPATTVKIGAD